MQREDVFKYSAGRQRRHAREDVEDDQDGRGGCVLLCDFEDFCSRMTFLDICHRLIYSVKLAYFGDLSMFVLCWTSKFPFSL